MRRRITRPRAGLAPTHGPSGSTGTAEDTVLDARWRGDMVSSCQSSVAFLGTLITLDACAGTLDVARAALWVGLGLLLFLVLVPPRVTAGHGWLRSRRLWREHCVRTDRLACVHWSQAGAQRLILRDAHGGRVEVDASVLAANPALWRLLDAGASRSRENGRLQRGDAVLREVSRRIDGATALAIFEASGLCCADETSRKPG